MKKLSAIGIAVVVLVACILVFGQKKAVVTDYAMNTVVSVTVKARNAEELAQEAMDEIRRIEKLASPTLPGSDVYKINSAEAGTSVEVSPEICELIALCGEISAKTEGAFDITTYPLSLLWDIGAPEPEVPEAEDISEALVRVNYKAVVTDTRASTVTLMEEGMAISLGAVAKGYAADCVARLLEERGVEDALIDIGGNIYALGEKNIGIQTPFEERGEYFTAKAVEDCSVVTSGAYERCFEKDGKIYHHIIDPQTGYPARSGLESATVISKSSVLADALSTAIFVLGEEKSSDIVKSFEDVSVLVLTEEGDIREFDGN